MTTEYTHNFRLNLPDFRTAPWHDLINTDFVMIDELLMSVFQGVDTRPWTNNYPFKAGMTAIDQTDNTFWVCIIDHMSAPVPTTFAQDRAANPTYWNRIVVGVSPRGDWQPSTHYLINDIVVDSVEGIIGVCNQEHTSSPLPATIRTDAAYWNFLTDFHGTSIEAIYVKYNNVVSAVSAVNVQEALDLGFANAVLLSGRVDDNVDAIAALDSRVSNTETTNVNQDNQINNAVVAFNELEIRVDNLETQGPATEAFQVTYENLQGEPFTELQTGTSYLYSHMGIAEQTIAILDGRLDTIEAGGGGSGGGVPLYIQSEPPSTPPTPSMWWETDTGILYVRYDDGTSAQWVVAVPPGTTILPESILPLMNGIANAGVSEKFSRGDHVHPTDTAIAAGLGTKVSRDGDFMSGTLTMQVDGALTTSLAFNDTNAAGNYWMLGPQTGTGNPALLSLYGKDKILQYWNVDGTVNIPGSAVVSGTGWVGGSFTAGGHISTNEGLTLQVDEPSGGVIYFGNSAAYSLQQVGNNMTVNGAAFYLPLGGQHCYIGGNIYTGYASPNVGSLYFGNNGSKSLYCNGTDFTFNGGLIVSGTNGIYVSAGGANIAGALSAGATTINGTLTLKQGDNHISSGGMNGFFYASPGGGNDRYFVGTEGSGDIFRFYSTSASNHCQFNGNGDWSWTKGLTAPGISLSQSGMNIAMGGGSSFIVNAYSGQAMLTFHNSGAFGTNFGMSSDGNFYMGGWSHGTNVAYKFWTTRDFAGVPTTGGVTGVRLAMAADYAHTAIGVTEPYGGAVVTGGSPVVSGSYYYSRYRWLQTLVNGGWATVGLA
jgi:hypothetical protein